MAFNFKDVANASANPVSRRLRAYEIHEVTFDEAKIEDKEIKKGDDAGSVKKVLIVRFSNEHGSYEEMVFLPDINNPKDTERTDNNWGGKNPSSADRAKYFIIHVLGQLNPEGFTKFQEICSKTEFKSFVQFAEVFVKLMASVQGVKTKLKLVGKSSNGNIQPALPFFCAISKDGNPYLKDAFLGDAVAFTASELQKKAQFEAAKPTPMDGGDAPAGEDPSLAAVAAMDTAGASDADISAMLDSLDKGL